MFFVDKIYFIFYIHIMIKKPVQIYESTFNEINTHKGDNNIASFIDTAILYYIQHESDMSEYKKINERLLEIHETVKTNLGLNCEVLRQAGILNGNGEITFSKS